MAIDRTSLGRAYAIAATAHQEQTDKAGAPYFDHLFEVKRRAVKSFRRTAWKESEELEISVAVVAILHDTLEDCDEADVGMLHSRIYVEFGQVVYDAVTAITKVPGEEYRTYLKRVRGNWLAKIVKLADLSHNLEAWRIPENEITEKDYERWDKYHRAFVYLMRGEA